MSKSLDSFQEILSDKEYEQLFSVLLTDRGTEFIKSQQFEVNIHTGEIRGKIFYCDPMKSSQKPHVKIITILEKYFQMFKIGII